MFSATQFLRIARFNSALPTITDGDSAPLQVDSNGRLLVSQDVNVSVDFLGLNGAADSSNILIVGTEDGTSTGTAHAVRLASNGAVIIDDGGGSISIDDGGGSITVDAVDLDIRDLSHTQDSVRIGDGVDLLDIVNEGDALAGNDQGIVVYGKDDSGNAETLNFDATGQLLVTSGPTGADSNEYSDLGTDGVVESIGTTFTDLGTDIAVAAGQTLIIYGAYGDADKPAFYRIVRKTSATVDQVYLAGQSVESRAYEPRIPEAAPIVIAGGANITVNIQARKQTGGTVGCSGTLFARLLS